MKKLVFAFGLLFLCAGLPVEAQNYHQSYGNGRVVQQNQTGLFHSDPSYISAGTMSRSAQGKAAGMTNGGLPTTSWGGYIRNPGDDIYTGNNGAMRQQNGSMVYGDEIARANMAAEMKRQRMMMQYQQQQRQNYYGRQQGNFYVPGSNGGAANYGSGVSGYGSYR
ncbi:MAG: hypothetical protein K2X27_23015 [Candidatus Obscuribacterales bacterium]|nr:hypothetical protein [Candidatus Obscuribacterales bacterium]